MTFSQKILTAHTALMRAALVSWNYKILWLQYLLIPVLATALVISATVNCTIRELLTQNLGFCRLLPPHTDSFFQIILVLLWLFFSAAFLRQVYAIMNGAPLTFKKSF